MSERHPKLQAAIEEHIRGLSWGPDALDHEKTMVAGNIRHAVFCLVADRILVPAEELGHIAVALGAAGDVIAERNRQVDAEGYSHQHDDDHGKGQIAAAGGCYALFSDAYPNEGKPPPDWPWEPGWWKPKDYRRDLVRAAALTIAEIERLDRAAEKRSETP